jgi:hypothetical protein
MNSIVKRKKAYLSALGTMGRKHLKALIKVGCLVEACDPNIDAFDIAKSELIQAGLDYKKFVRVEKPCGRYDFAIFSETASSRLNNFKYFLDNAFAHKILLEKPLSANPSEFEVFIELAEEKGVEDRIQVNLVRRLWDHITIINEYCKNEDDFVMTINGGAIGLGCNGIHYLDNFILFSDNEMPVVKWVKLSKNLVKSGRGKQFYDYGGNFVIETSKGTLMASITANSSSNILMTLKGKHFMIIVDYNNFSWKILRRKDNVDLPLYRYGAEYENIKNGKFELPTADFLTEQWTKGAVELPSLKKSLLSHKIIENILTAGGIEPPYNFT